MPPWEVSDPAFETEGIRHLTVRSAALGGRGDITIWVPQDLPTGRQPAILLLLHGVGASHWAWFGSGGVHRTAERLVRAGEVAPVVLACPSDGLGGDGTAYLDRPGSLSETWVVSEALSAVRDVLGPNRGSGPAAIAGLSMGGFGALRLAVRHPGLFRAVVGLSSVTRFEDLLDFTTDLPPIDDIPPGELDLRDVVLTAQRPLPAIRLVCGTEDPLLAANRDLHAVLDRVGVPHEYAEHSGGHSWAYWRAQFEDCLRFVNRHLGSG